MDTQATPGERNQRARAGRPGGKVRWPVRRGGDSWSNRWTCAEKLSVETACSDAPGDKTRGQVTGEGRWPTDEEVGMAWYFLFPQLYVGIARDVARASSWQETVGERRCDTKVLSHSAR
jgi:hypothetical protein